MMNPCTPGGGGVTLTHNMSYNKAKENYHGRNRLTQKLLIYGTVLCPLTVTLPIDSIYNAFKVTLTLLFFSMI